MNNSLVNRRQRYKPKKCDVFCHAVSNIAIKHSDGNIFELRSGFDFSFAGKKVRNFLLFPFYNFIPGYNNVIAGLCDAVISHSASSEIFYTAEGIKGILDNDLKRINKSSFKRMLNQPCSLAPVFGKRMILTGELFEKITQVLVYQEIDVIVLFSSAREDDILRFQEYLEQRKLSIRFVVISDKFSSCVQGFNGIGLGTDTFSKACSQIISNIQTEMLLYQNEYHFISLPKTNSMDLLLECAINCQSTFTLVPDEIQKKNVSFSTVVNLIVDCIKMRKIHGKNYGIILFPEDILQTIFYNSKENLANSINISDPAEALSGEVSKKIMGYYFNCKYHKIDLSMICGFPTNFDCTFAYNLGFCVFLLGLYGKTNLIAQIDMTDRNPKRWFGRGVDFRNAMVSCIQSSNSSVSSTGDILYDRFRQRRTDYMLKDKITFQDSMYYIANNLDEPNSLAFARNYHKK